MKILVLFLLSFSAFASEQNIVQQKLSAKDGQSPFDILKEFHMSEGSPARLTEVNSLNVDTGEPTKVFSNCVATNFNYPSKLEEARLDLWMVNKIIPAIPSNGPLFPGTPSKTIPLLSFDTISRYPGINDAIWMGERTTTLISKIDGLILHLNASNFTQNHVEIKKHGELLSFYLSHNDGVSISYESYGYCWNE